METSQEVLDYVARLPIGAHAVLFYEEQETARQVFSALVKGGIERGERTVFISTSLKGRERFAGIESASNSDLVEQAGFISLSDFCFEGQHLSWSKAKNQVKDLIANVDGSHVKGVRVIVLADQCLKRTTRDELLRFEKEWGRSLQLPVSVICSYDTGNLGERNWGDLLLDLCKAHGHLIFQKLAAPRE